MTTINYEYTVYDKGNFERTLNKIVKRYKATVEVVWGVPEEVELLIPAYNPFADMWGERKVKVHQHPVSVTFDFDHFRIDGYTYLGCIKDEMMMGLISIHGNEELEGQDISDFVKSFDKIPCHHCGRRHRRKVGHLFQVNDTGEHLVFGSSCAKNFFGINFDRLLTFSARLHDLFRTGWDSDYLTGYRDKTIDWRYVARLSYYWISKHGYLSGSKAREFEKASTTDYVRGMYQDNPDLLTPEVLEEIRDMDIPDPDVLMDAQFVDDPENPKNEFEHNLVVLQEKMRQNMVTYHEYGFMTYLVFRHFFYTEERPERVEYIIPEWAVEGRRIAKGKMELDCEVTHTHSFDGYYGRTYIYTFVSGNVRFKWFTNSVNLEVGDTLTLNGFTIKKVEDDKYGKSLVINRPIIKVHEEA